MLKKKVTLNINRLAPLADRASTQQLRFLLQNSPIVIAVNNYKADFSNINIVRNLANQNQGFAYQPNKNIKIRASAGLGMGFSPDMLDGLVIFIFFQSSPNSLKFIDELKTKSLTNLSYFSILSYGHASSLSALSADKLLISNNSLLLSVIGLNCNKNVIKIILNLHNLLTKVCLIWQVYVKLHNKESLVFI